jgi:glycosyltransferase involved in cell wall biosynthesis
LAPGEVTLAHLADIALISLATTPGLVRSDAAFAQLLRDCGASVEVVPVRIGRSGRLRRHPAATDLVEALAARRSARGVDARAVVYSTTTAALLQRLPAVPFAVRFDATAALNRPAGWPSAWQRKREREVLSRASVLLPVSDGAAAELPDPHAPVVRVPIPVDDVPAASERDIDAVAYAGYPRKRGLELICAAWDRVGPPGGRLVIGGTDREKAMRWLDRAGVPEPAGVEWAGMVPREEWLGTVARARVFVNGSRWEDYGVAQFEAIAAGTFVVSVPSPGPYEALPLLRELAPSLVTAEISADALAGALRTALDWDDAVRALYATRGRALLAPYRAASLRRVVADEVLPALGIAPS